MNKWSTENVFLMVGGGGLLGAAISVFLNQLRVLFFLGYIKIIFR
jgi:hypothetical protein